MSEIRAMRPRPWPIRAWLRARQAVADWRDRERFAWEVYTALRQVPLNFSMKRFDRCTEGWVAEGVLPESGERFQGIHQHPYVALRRMSLTAQFEKIRAPSSPSDWGDVRKKVMAKLASLEKANG